LEGGHKEAVAPEAVFVEGNFADGRLLDEIFPLYQIDSVIHMAAYASVPDSLKHPQRYFKNNVVNGITLLDAMLKHGVKRVIFSSTAAVYGEPQTIPIDETHPEEPINAYGDSKLMFEKILKWYHQAYHFNFVSLRYFNACGASKRFGEHHEPETHLIPIILQVALGQRQCVYIFGTDYDTKDGTCIRDYIHVVDLAKAHVLALEQVDCLSSRIYNLGNGSGFSVKEVIETAKEVTGKPITAIADDRRMGDPAVLVASSERIKSELGGKPVYTDLYTIIQSAWEWHQNHPNGYTP
jgi:UDP-glucose 4-epimerase